MKTTKATWLKLFLLWATLAGVFPAHAFYDPGVQRWLTSDPVEDSGFQNLTLTHRRSESRRENLHCFIENAPLTKRDHWELGPGDMNHSEPDFKKFEDCMGCKSNLKRD